MKLLLANVAFLSILILSGPLAYASGTGDHHHGEEPIVEEVSDQGHEPDPMPHDNADGHHGEAEPVVHDNADGHHGAPADYPDEEAVEDHRDDTMPDHPDDMAASGGHDHSSHEDGTWATTEFEAVLAWLGKFHPAATNFPIALLLAAFLAEALFVGTGNASLRAAARFCLWTGAIGAVGTTLLGWGFVGFDTASDDSILSAHRWNGTAIGVLSLIALWLGERTFAGKSSAALFRIALVAVALMAGYNGMLGGKMVYGEDHYDWPVR